MPTHHKATSLPETIVLAYSDPPDVAGGRMEFRLIYKGSLPAETNHPRPEYKHAVRKQLHPQLRELWHTHPDLKRRQKYSNIDDVANNYARFGYRFIPLIDATLGLACSLDILFLRRDGPGSLINNCGDIDNRIKVLFDGLRMPDNFNETAKSPPANGEDPFFVLMKNDNLITEVKITTDRLLLPKETLEQIQDVCLIIHVSMLMIDTRLGMESSGLIDEPGDLQV